MHRDLLRRCNGNVVGEVEATAAAALGELGFYALRCDIVERGAGDAALWEPFKRGERAL